MSVEREPLGARMPTGSIRGKVTAVDGSPVPDVLVTADSYTMEGTRTTVTGQTGEFILRHLEPGGYTLTFEQLGWARVESSANVVKGQTTQVNVGMQKKSAE